MKRSSPLVRLVDNEFGRPAIAYTGYLIRSQWRAALYWGLALGLMVLWVIAYYPSFSKSAFMQQYLDALPPALRAIFNLTSDMSSIQGWLAFEVFNLILPVSLPIYAMVIGTRAIAGAEQQKRLDLLLSVPIARWQVVASSFFEMVGGLLEVLAIVAVFAWIPAKVIGTDLTITQTLAGVLNVLPLALFFGCLALFASSMVRHPGVSTGVAASCLVAMYFVNGFGQYVASLASLRRFSVFYYYGSAIEHGIQWRPWLAMLGISVGLAGLAIAAFNRRDILT